MRVLICGDRDWNSLAAIYRELSKFPRDTVVIEGECRGADLLGRKVAEALGMQVEPYPALWDKYGNAAGPIRNQQMLDEGKPDLVLAFHEDITRSRGTKDMINRAKKQKIEVRLFNK